MFDPNIRVTAHVENVPGLPALAVTIGISPEVVFNESLDGRGIHLAFEGLGYQVADALLGDLRKAKWERDRLEAELGGPVTAARMMAHITNLLDRAGDEEYSRLAAAGKEREMWTPGADPYETGMDSDPKGRTEPEATDG
jgi:hypothetical protein